MSLTERALSLATEKHRGQVDKGGAPYIRHPEAVARMLETDDEKVVALLHDIVEDTDVTLGDLEPLGFSKKQIDAIDALTKRRGESYESYLSRVRGNALARKVKVADITHNMDTSRLKTVTSADLSRLERYRTALETLR